MPPSDFLIIGFSDKPSLARQIAKRLRTRPAFAKVSHYSAGELWIKSPLTNVKNVLLISDISENPASLLQGLALAQNVRNQGAKQVTLLCPWIAYGRQDRPDQDGSIAIGTTIGQSLSRAFDRIVTLDAHSQAFIHSFEEKLINILPSFADVPKRFDAVAAPDNGAIGRASIAAKALELPLITLEKQRIGKRVLTHLSKKSPIPHGACVLLVDDIGDTGKTLIAAAKALRTSGASSVQALVTHANDLTALRQATKNDLASVNAFYDHRTGRLSSAALTALIENSLP